MPLFERFCVPTVTFPAHEEAFQELSSLGISSIVIASWTTAKPPASRSWRRAKAHPGKLRHRQQPHLAGELLKQMAGIERTHVPFRGASPALNDLIPGRVDCYFGSGVLLENMRSGQLRGLAVTGAKRDPVAPELPTMAEAGVPGYEVSSWHGLFVPARTPPEIVRKMSVDTIAALADPVVKSKLEQAGYMVVGSSPDELKTLLKSEVDKWSAVIETVRIKIN